jgi:hypothetical protein
MGLSRGTSPFIRHLNTRWKWVANFTPRVIYPRIINPVQIEQEDGWAPQLVRASWNRDKYVAAAGNWNAEPSNPWLTYYTDDDIRTPPYQQTEEV